MDKLPRDIRKAVDESPTGSIYTEVPAHSKFPDMNRISALFIDVRDDIAKAIDSPPEDVVLIGVRVFYRLGQETVGNGHYYAIGSREEYDPEFEHVLREIE